MYNQVVNGVSSNIAKFVLTIATAKAVEITDVNLLRINPLSFLPGLAIVQAALFADASL